MYPPITLSASYLTTTEYQRVWWTARIWWRNPDGTLGHTAVSSQASDLGWFSTPARSGDNYGGMTSFVGRGSISGGEALTWNDQQYGRAQPADFVLHSYLNTTIIKVFAVEYIYYWEATDRQPQAGWASHMVNFDDGYGGGGTTPVCRFP